MQCYDVFCLLRGGCFVLVAAVHAVDVSGVNLLLWPTRKIACLMSHFSPSASTWSSTLNQRRKCPFSGPSQWSVSVGNEKRTIFIGH